MKIHRDLQSIFVWQLFSGLDDAVSHPDTLWRRAGFIVGFVFNGRESCWFSDAELVFIQKICVSLKWQQNKCLIGMGDFYASRDCKKHKTPNISNLLSATEQRH